MNYLIWSNGHGAWWRPGKHGYTTDQEYAGRYGREEAEGIVERAGTYEAPDGLANEVMVVAPEHRWDSGPPPPMRKTSITCPACKMTSYNPLDIEQGYCGVCHDWTSVALTTAP